MAGMIGPMNTQQDQSLTSERIHVAVRSEIDTLKTVVMCWANPCRINLSMALSVFDSSVREQLRYNTWGSYDYVRVREQQQRVVEVLRDHGVTVLFLDNVPGLAVNITHAISRSASTMRSSSPGWGRDTVNTNNVPSQPFCRACRRLCGWSVGGSKAAM